MNSRVWATRSGGVEDPAGVVRVGAGGTGDPPPARVEKSSERIEHLVDIKALGVAEPFRYRPNGAASGVVTCAGRLWVEQVMGECITEPLDKSRIRKLVERATQRFAGEELLHR